MYYEREQYYVFIHEKDLTKTDLKRYEVYRFMKHENVFGNDKRKIFYIV